MICFNCKLLLPDANIRSSVCWPVLSEENMKYLWAFTIYCVLSVALAEGGFGLESKLPRTEKDFEQAAEPLLALARSMALEERTAGSSAEQSNVAARSRRRKSNPFFDAAKYVLDNADSFQGGYPDEGAGNLINFARSIVLAENQNDDA